MNQFLSYEILGIMSVQTYLIVAAISLVLSLAFGKDKNSFPKEVCQALIWPLSLTVAVVCFAFAALCYLVACCIKVFVK